MSVQPNPNRFAAILILVIGVTLAAYVFSYFALSEMRTLPLPTQLTDTRVFESRTTYLIYSPLRWLESAVTDRETAYRN